MDKDYMQPGSAPVSQDKTYIADMIKKVNPYAPPVFISKGTVETTLGGVTTFKDINGGTLLTYDPETGTITIYGGLTVSNITTGTYQSIVFAGTNVLTGSISGGNIYSTLQGTVNSSVIGTPNLSGGTVNAGTYQVGGTAGVTGLGTYVKTVDFAGSTVTLGTIKVDRGIVTSIN